MPTNGDRESGGFVVCDGGWVGVGCCGRRSIGGGGEKEKSVVV